MTKIYIKGLLAKKFGSFFEINISNILCALKAIDANRSGFLKEIFDLNKKNLNYFIICDGIQILNENEFLEKKKIKSLHIVPAITGSGAAVAAGIGIAANTAAFAVVEFLVNFIVATAISLGVSLLMNSLNKQAAPPGAQKMAVGGVTSSIEAQGKSYVFSNNLNTASQGSSIPVGYGKLKSSSQVLMASVKNYSTSISSNSEFKASQNSSIFLDFLTD